jgi:hypothetical protein
MMVWVAFWLIFVYSGRRYGYWLALGIAFPLVLVSQTTFLGYFIGRLHHDHQHHEIRLVREPVMKGKIVRAGNGGVLFIDAHNIWSTGD